MRKAIAKKTIPMVGMCAHGGGGGNDDDDDVGCIAIFENFIGNDDEA